MQVLSCVDGGPGRGEVCVPPGSPYRLVEIESILENDLRTRAYIDDLLATCAER